MRLCHINLSKELRGGENQTIALVECLAAHYSQSVVVRRDSPLHRRLDARRLEGVRILPVPSSVPAAVRAAREVDLIHVHEGRSVQAGALRSLLGTPFVVTRRVLTAPGSNPVTRWCYGRAAAVVGVSEAVSSIMRAYLGDGDVVTILDATPRLTADPAETAALRSRFAGKFVVGHVGELNDGHKGQLVIIEAARTALETRPELHFVLLGSGPDEERLRALARELPNVELEGRVDNVGDYYAAMDLFVFPSRDEALGSAILEAMASGLPVVASAIGGIPEIVEPGGNGLLFDAGDAAAMYAAVVKLADDAELRETLRAGALATARAHSAESCAQSYACVYERALAR